MSREIIFVTDVLVNGGSERVMTELINDWAIKGYSVYLVTLMAEEFSEHYALLDSVKLVHIPVISGNKLSRIFHSCAVLARFLREHSDAVTIAITLGAIRKLAVTATITGNKLILSERNDPRRYPPTVTERLIHRAAMYFGNADVYVFQTEEAMRFYPKRMQKRGVIIPNPIDPHLPERWMGERRKRIVAVGRLVSQKNFTLLIRSFVKLNHEHPDYVLEIYGRGFEDVSDNEEPLLRRMIGSLHMEDKIFLMGFSDQIYDKMKDCSLYVSSSDYEGISNSMLEALGLGLPCVCTDCPVGGARMVIRDGENGLLVPVGDEDALYRAMKRVIEDPALAKKLGDNAYKVREEYSVDKISRQWLDVMGF